MADTTVIDPTVLFSMSEERTFHIKGLVNMSNCVI